MCIHSFPQAFIDLLPEKLLDAGKTKISPRKDSDKQINSQGTVMSDVIDLHMMCHRSRKKNNLT